MKKIYTSLFILVSLLVKSQATSPVVCFSSLFSANLTTVGATPMQLCKADFNADGKLDVAVANYGSNNVSVLLGSGTGTFAPAVNYATGTGPWAITSGDFNNDGKPDLAVTNFSSNNVSVLIGTGSGAFLSYSNSGF